MIFFILYQSTSFEPFDYRDENQEVLIGCSSELSGEVVIPRTVKEIYSEGEYNYAFKNCRETITSIKFEEDNKIISINNYSFYETKIESADLSNCNHLTLLNGTVFRDCRRLKSVLLPPNISSIGSFCFYFNALTSVDLPDSVETIYEYAFRYSGLTTINISKNSNLKKIYYGCFDNAKFTTFFIPKSLDEISSDAFSYCFCLENISVDPENKCYKSDSKNVFTGTDNSTLFRVASSYSGEYIVPSYVTKISNWCFFKANISSIQLHNNITCIGDNAFNYCSLLSYIELPMNITCIGALTFYFCTSLSSIAIPDNVIYIDVLAFSYCSLKNITIPEKVTHIFGGAFCDCRSLSNIIIPKNVIYIGDGVFSRCTSLTNITFLNNINTITFKRNAFEHIQNPMNIYIPGKFIISILINLEEDDEEDFNEEDYFSVFPNGSNLYITSQTVLSNSSRALFGEKRFHVHFDNTIKLSDQTTIDVLQYISIENISIALLAPKTLHNNIWYPSKLFHLMNLFISISKRAVS
ncbi:Leucine Rich Repeat family protein [Trichomonas vaginalis G3]|uniref:Leucine Rich Repeat family protein n=1 Tax=Trichomonas vaginalis (strain ATCC PRA-98 / G3) TaxID=412133 RepID=A2EVG5_TRIV3|nr:uncharacterized protein TVAGG3_0526680 [Trichomonas vaginalis G3]EAY03351.1 Leucine Rich Repeat family protein [Trichomonas vaginalis G3]KAI5518826.1 ribonuclease inhibitor domain-containing protein [Trichomonas vaginalis G3]|eukprot:XP_001315574.1 hypothetical protein [Trichomonas vaginalis G3]